jgi:SAM-dependent methyltransferase
MVTSEHATDGTAPVPAELAARLVRVLHPGSVFELGCGSGELVTALRAIGVEARGREADATLARSCPDETAPHIEHGALDEPLDDKYDLIMSIDSLDHLDADLAARSIELAVAHSDRVLIGSSAPGDARNAPEDLAAVLASHGFLRSVSSGTGLLPAHLVLYERHAAPSIIEVVRSSERTARRRELELSELRGRVGELEADLAALGQHSTSGADSAQFARQLETATAERDRAVEEFARARSELEAATARFESRIDGIERESAEARAELHERRLEVLRLRDRVIGREAELGTALGRLAEAESELQASTDLSIRYQEVVGTRSWRLLWKVMAPYRWVRERLAEVR